jgi:ABC-type glycerol-3-phosphate transport system substrate-binding protein
MKYILGICFLVLVLASVITYKLMPEAQNKVPIIYWVTDQNPARELQVDIFHKWLKKHGYPQCELRVDAANTDVAKIVIQSVSGVAGDLIDQGGYQIDYYTSIGLLKDVTDSAKKMGFDPGKTYPAVRNEITEDGRQFTFPCNVGSVLYFINKATFEKYGQPIPPPRWTVEEFEKAGKAFVEKANEGKERREVFFASGVDDVTMCRSAGMDTYNETQTACVLDDMRYVKVLKLIYKWTYEDHILPSTAEAAAFNTVAGYGGATFQLFNNGNYGMVGNGRHALIQFRKFGSLSLAATEPPHMGYPVTLIGIRSCGIYTASKNAELAKYFMAFLASEDYNMNIVRDADALPPRPEFLKREEYLRPKDYPNEWGCHEMFARAALEISVTANSSPFVLYSLATRHMRFYRDQFMNNRLTAEETAHQMMVRINEEMARSLRENPKLQSLYNGRMEIQKKIEARRSEGKKIPASWLFNAFHQKYYRDMGWVEEEPK